MKKHLILILMLMPTLSFGKIGLGLNAGIVPNSYSASAKTPGISKSNTGAAFSGKVTFGKLIQTGVVAEIGNMGTLPSTYFAGGLLGNVVLGIKKVDIYGGGTIRYLTSGSNENKSRGFDYGAQVGLNIKLVSKLSLNLEGGVRYARLVESVNNPLVSASPIDFKQRIVAYPIMIGVRFEL